MPISEMSDEDRAELFLVLGNVREEIHELRGASKNLRQVVVPRYEHDVRRRFTWTLFFVGILLAMNLHDLHIQHCMTPTAHVRPGSATAWACDVGFPAHAHAHMHGTLSSDPSWGSYPSPGNMLGLVAYVLIFGYAATAAIRVQRLNRRVWK
jgi:hypothetical protein